MMPNVISIRLENLLVDDKQSPTHCKKGLCIDNADIYHSCSSEAAVRVFNPCVLTGGTPTWKYTSDKNKSTTREA